MSRIALPASIVLNLFLIAVIGGHVWRVRHADVGAVTSVGRALANIEANLNQHDAAAFNAVMQRDEPRLSAAWQQLAQTRRALARQLTADPLDKQAAKQALTDWRTSGNHFLDEFGDTLIEALAQVSPEGRRKVVAQRDPSARSSQ